MSTRFTVLLEPYPPQRMNVAILWINGHISKTAVNHKPDWSNLTSTRAAFRLVNNTMPARKIGAIFESNLL
jgi:hypothetical protein